MKIGRRISVFEFNLLYRGSRPTLFLWCQTYRLGNEELPAGFFKDLPAFEVIDLEVSSQHLIGIFLLLVVSGYVIGQKK